MQVLWFLSWYVISTLTGWAAFPLAYRFFPRLPDRGYALARALGWLLWGYLFWMLGSLGLLQNDLGGEIFAFLLLAGFAAAAAWGKTWADIREWLASHRRYLLSAEAVFLLAFALMAVIRAANPTIDGTEKPMELAFLNAILKSPTFPPHDPWLSGYAISYYYFGYVLVTMFIRLSGAATGVGFNLAIALLFGLTALGAYGILYDLLALRPRRAERGQGVHPPLGLPVLGPIFILVMGNLEGILAVLHDRGIFWTQSGGTWQSGFWSWLGVLELNQPPLLPLSWIPHYSFIPWWRASRVLADYTLSGGFKEVIDEFPFFSYLLSDLHPHVLAMPFALLMVGLGMNIWLYAREKGLSLFGFQLPFSRGGFLLTAVLLGSLAFLNTWDFPIYVALAAGAFALGRLPVRGWRWTLLGDFAGFGLIMGFCGAVLYIPFFIGFSSQAGGIIPSMVFFTRGTQFWVMFGTLLVPILAFLAWQLASRRGVKPDLRRGFTIVIAGMLALWLGMLSVGVLASLLPGLGPLFMSNLGAGDATIGQVIRASLLGFTTADTGYLPGRLTAPGAWISLTVLIGLILAVLIGFRPAAVEEDDAELPSAPAEEDPDLPADRPQAFWLLLVLLGALLVLAPEFFYLRDQFGSRMNTIFKFYFTAWILWGLCAAYASAVLLSEARRGWGTAWRLAFLALLAVGFAYPAWGLLTKTGGFNPGSWTLDGDAYLTISAPDEMAAVRWLEQQPPGVIAEAAGDSYHSETSRAATQTGYATVLGWIGHELQWRGSAEALGSRQGDLETLYQTSDWGETLRIIQAYDIRYIFIGPTERDKYRVSEAKFQRNLSDVFRSGQVEVYAVPETSPVVSQAAGNEGTNP